MEMKNCMKITVVVLLSLWMTTQVVSGETTTTSGILIQDEIWSGNVYVTGDVVIPKGITLIMLAGTVVNFASNHSDYDTRLSLLAGLGEGKCNLVVQGNLRIEGEENKVVTVGELIYDLKRQSKMSWGGIIFEGINALSIVRHAKIRYADVAIVCLNSSSPRIVNNTITENDVGIMTFDLSSPRVTSNRIHNSTLWSISCYDYSFPMISHNIIESSEVGIGCEDFSLPIIRYNTFSNNSVDILIQGDSNPTEVGNIFRNNKLRTDING